MTTADAGAQAPAGSVNGTIPGAPAEEPCETCVTKGELALAVLGGLIGAGIIVMAIDLAAGGRFSRALGLGGARGEAAADDGNSGA